MPSYKSTAEFACDQLRREDWLTRHRVLARLGTKRPVLHARCIELLSPDECLYGLDTMPALPDYVVIVMKDKDRADSHLVQTKITKYFRRARPVR